MMDVRNKVVLTGAQKYDNKWFVELFSKAVSDLITYFWAPGTRGTQVASRYALLSIKYGLLRGTVVSCGLSFWATRLSRLSLSSTIKTRLVCRFPTQYIYIYGYTHGFRTGTCSNMVLAVSGHPQAFIQTQSEDQEPPPVTCIEGTFESYQYPVP